MAEPFTRLLLQLQEEGQFSYILAPSSTFGRNLLPRTAALLDVSMLSDVSGILDKRTVVRWAQPPPLLLSHSLCSGLYTCPLVTGRSTRATLSARCAFPSGAHIC